MRAKLSSALTVLPLLMYGTIYSMDDPFVHLETVAARLTTDRPDPLVVDLVADAVFAVPHFKLLQQVPPEVSAIVKQRFAIAEIAYWNGRQNGVGESDIAFALNKIVEQLSLPDYAKTTQSQIRYLRMRMLQKNPRFLGLSFAKSSSTGERLFVNERMSPLQAYYLIMTFSGPEIRFRLLSSDPGRVGSTQRQISSWVGRLRNEIAPTCRY